MNILSEKYPHVFSAFCRLLSFGAGVVTFGATTALALVVGARDAKNEINFAVRYGYSNFCFQGSTKEEVRDSWETSGRGRTCKI